MNSHGRVNAKIVTDRVVVAHLRMGLHGVQSLKSAVGAMRRMASGQPGRALPFSIRGLVLAGTFIVTQDDQRTVYGPGQIFAVDHEHPHDESIGPEGARARWSQIPERVSHQPFGIGPVI